MKMSLWQSRDPGLPVGLGGLGLVLHLLLARLLLPRLERLVVALTNFHFNPSPNIQ